MNVVMRSVGVLVTLGLIAVSVMMNFRFGQSLGRTEWDGLVYGLASACADGFKVILPFAIMAAWTGRRRFAASAGAALWLVFTAYSMTSSLGHSAVNRAESAGERKHQIADYQHVRRSLEVKLRERESLPTARPIVALEAQLKIAQGSHRFERTQRCTDVGRIDSSFCEDVARLEAERAIGRRAHELDEEITRLKGILDAASGAARSEQGDAQAAMLGELSGMAEGYVRMALTLLVSVMVELGSGLGMYVVLGRKSAAEIAGPHVAEIRPRRGGSLRRWLTPNPEQSWRRARVIRDDGGHVSEIDLYRDYCLWIVRQDRGPAMTLGQFRSWAEREALGELVRKRGRNYYMGLRLNSDRGEPLRLQNLLSPSSEGNGAPQ